MTTRSIAGRLRHARARLILFAMIVMPFVVAACNNGKGGNGY